MNLSRLYSCGWYENSESTRLAFFRAEMTGMSGFRPFYYSAEFYNSTTPDPLEVDNWKNCEEWRSKLGKEIGIKDIYQILYKTEPEKFQSAFETNRLKDSFPQNTFIVKLLLPENKAFLEYIRFSKELEYYSFKASGKWEQWDNIDRWNSISGVELQKDYSYIKQLMARLKDDFLKQRYAFQLIKIGFYQANYSDIANYYSGFFSRLKDSTILAPWALNYYAQAEDIMGNHAKANYLYSRIFDRCESKKYIVMQWFNKKNDIIEQSLALAASDQEKAVILAMAAMRDPGPALKRIQRIHDQHPDDRYFAFLVMREINKLEDWIYTPAYTEYSPSVNYGNSWDDWYELDKSGIREKNRKKDLGYARELKEYLKGCIDNSAGELHDFLVVAIAHLCFINDEIFAGKFYLSGISANASESIILQKNIQLALIKLKKEDLSTPASQNEILQFLRSIERTAINDPDAYKTLYSLCRLISKEYQDRNDGALAGLFFLRSEKYKADFETHAVESNYETYYDYFQPDYYFNIAYFDRYANIEDVDKLIAMISNSKKTAFEKYLCSRFKDVKPFLDLKATIAFRNSDLALAEKTFAQIPAKFWDTAYAFRDYLNEDPFVPKRLSYTYKRNFNYHFNKHTFVQTLNQLLQTAKASKSAESYLKLGHAFFNCSYWGNSWMMCSYGQGYEEQYNYSSDYIFGSTFRQRMKIQDGNYYNCTIAEKYYRKALEYARTDEQRAMANLMIHCCKEAAYEFKYINTDDTDKIPPFKAGKELMDFYSLKNTQAFRTYNCPEMDEYIAKSK